MPSTNSFTTTTKIDDLSASAKIINGGLAAEDEYPDPFELFASSFVPFPCVWFDGQDIGRNSGEYSEQYHQLPESFVISRDIPLPAAILEQYDLVQSRCFMGFFPEIERVWITVDHRLYLWSIKDPEDYFEFEETDQIIIGVGLVKPKPGIFVDSVENLIILSTPTELIILGLKFDKNTRKIDLYLTELKANTDNLLLNQIVGTNDGRIFLCGNSQHVFELVYNGWSSWLSRRCQLVNVTGHQLSFLIPSFVPFVGFGETDELSTICVDKSRNLLYTLTKGSKIQVYHLRDCPGYIYLAKKIIDVQQRVSGLLGSSQNLQNMRITDIVPVSYSESKRILLVAMTSTGLRLYFGIVHGLSEESFDLLHVRMPPSSARNYKPSQTLNDHSLPFCNRGISILLLASPDQRDRLICVAQDSAKLISRQNRQMLEYAEARTLEGKSWSVTEISKWMVDEKDTDAADFCVLNNELYTQINYTPRSFLVISNGGILVLSKKRPIDILSDLLRASFVSEAQLNGFADTFGHTQLCAMCLALTSNSFVPERPLPQSVLDNAKLILTRYGGRPQFKQKTITATSIDEIGRPLFTEETIYSNKHEGYVLHAARLVRPIWRKTLSQISIQAKNVEFQIYDVLAPIQERLNCLDSITPGFESYNLRFNTFSANSPDKRAEEMERKSMVGLTSLVKQAAEALSFLFFLMENNLEIILTKISPESRKRFNECTFEDFLSTESGRDLARDLIIAMVNLQETLQISIDAISDALGKRCPTFCIPEDILIFKGMERIRQAKSLKDVTAVDSALQESLKLFSQAAGHLKRNIFESICCDYNSLDFFGGSIKLAIARSKSKALEDEPEERKMTYEKAVVAIKIALKLRNNEKFKKYTLKEALAMDNYEFHCYLYDWFLREKLQTQLLQLESISLARYLASDENSLEKQDLLWQYYLSHGQLFEASQVLLSIAESERFIIPLKTRIEYLSRSLSNCRSALVNSDTYSEQLRFMEERMDVAKLQLLVWEEFQQTHPNLTGQGDFQALNEKLFNLNDLLYDYANKYKLYESWLAIFSVGGSRDPIINQLWSEMLTKIENDADDQGMNVFEAISRKLERVKNYCQSEVAFPIEYVVELLLWIGYRRERAIPGWAISLLVTLGVDYQKLFYQLHQRITAVGRGGRWNDNNALKYLFEELVFTLSRWQERRRALKEVTFPAKEVEQIIGQYLLSHARRLPPRLEKDLLNLQRQITIEG